MSSASALKIAPNVIAIRLKPVPAVKMHRSANVPKNAPNVIAIKPIRVNVAAVVTLMSQLRLQSNLNNSLNAQTPVV
jgi:hypothetical protein